MAVTAPRILVLAPANHESCLTPPPPPSQAGQGGPPEALALHGTPLLLPLAALRALRDPTGLSAVHSYGPWAGLTALLATRLAGLAHLHTPAWPPPTWRLPRLLDHLLACQATRLITRSAAAVGLSPRARYLPPAVDLAPYRSQPPRSRASRRPVVLCLTHHLSRRSLATLLDAMGLLASRGCPYRLWLQGSPEHGPRQARKLQSLIHSRSCAHVTIRSPDAPLTALLRGADALVHPASPAPATPAVVIQAMAAGLTVLAEAGSPAADLIDHGQTGIIFESGNHHALTGWLQQLLPDPRLRATIGRQAREAALDRHDVAQVWQALEGIYQEVAARRGRRALEEGRLRMLRLPGTNVR